MSTTQETTTLVSQLVANNEKFQDSATREEYCSQVREQAAEHFLNVLLASPEAKAKFEESALHRSKCCDQKTVRLEQWQGRGPTHLDQSLSDLLDIGDLLQRLQDHLDQTYGKDAFRVFNHSVRKTRNVALVVSWDKDGFSNADDIIERNRAKALERQERLQHRHQGDEDEDEDEERQRPRHRSNYGGDNRGPPRRNYGGDTRGPGRYEDRPARGARGGFRSRDDYDRSDRSFRGGEGMRPRRQDREPRQQVREGQQEQEEQRPSRRRAAVASYD